MKKLKYPTEKVEELWRKNFNNDSSKFVKSTNLIPEDLGRIFTDQKGKEWKILGSMEGKDMPCQLIETGEVFVWDRWKISLLLYPDQHEKFQKKSEILFPTKKKKKVEKIEEIEKEPEESDNQLNLFSE